jgi:hypothetical protein
MGKTAPAFLQMISALLVLSPNLLRWEYPVTLAGIILLTLALVLGIEKMAERGSGWPVPWGARLFIPLPAQLLLLTNFLLHFVHFRQVAELEVMVNVVGFIVLILPWVISSGDGRKTPLWLVFGVWASYVLYAATLLYLWGWVYTRLKATAAAL